MTLHKYIYYGDRINTREQFKINGLSLSSQFGLSPFEGIRSYTSDRNEHHIIELDTHLERLKNSCELLGLQCQFNSSCVKDALVKLHEANKIEDDAAFRIICFVEDELSWQSTKIPTKLVIAGITKSYVPVSERHHLNFCFSNRVRKPSRQSLPFQVKVGANYINSRYAHIEALQRGYDGSILLDDMGYISENGGSNVVFVNGDNVISPCTDSNILDGITLSIVEKLCDRLGISFVRKKITVEETNQFDGAFICGSAVEIAPVKIDGVRHLSQLPEVLHKEYIRCIRSGDPLISHDVI